MRIGILVLILINSLGVRAMEQDPLQKLIDELNDSLYFFNFGNDARHEAEHYFRQNARYTKNALIRNSSQKHMLSLTTFHSNTSGVYIDITPPNNAVFIDNKLDNVIPKKKMKGGPAVLAKAKDVISHCPIFVVYGDTKDHIKFIVKKNANRSHSFESFDDLVNYLNKHYMLLKREDSCSETLYINTELIS